MLSACKNLIIYIDNVCVFLFYFFIFTFIIITLF